MSWFLTFCIAITATPVFASNQTEEAMRKVAVDMQKNSLGQRLKSAKSEEEYLSIQKEAFEKGSHKLTEKVASSDDKTLAKYWKIVDEKMDIEHIEGLVIKGTSPREKINYINSSEFQVQISNYVKKEIKNAGGFENFKHSLTSAKSDCLSKEGKKCATERSVASTKDDVTLVFSMIGNVIFCIVLIPLCLVVLMYNQL